ncbi:hypothetical protein F7D20_06710 [Prevotella copri]|uniref:Uncharacterized protein n=1 Tax=Segatella copri TaxID=165179 RepID=A0A6A7WAZ3_9BACT|nr:hypothetical protein [Prevotella sp.]MQP11657.1 hypothetical protein [Segatella copri]
MYLSSTCSIIVCFLKSYAKIALSSAMKAIFQIAQCRISYAKLRFYFETNKDLSKKVASKI